MRDDYPTRACPGCGARKPSSKPVMASDPPAEALAFSEFSRYWDVSGGPRVFFSYHRCLDCGLLYCPRAFGAARNAEMYEAMRDNTQGLPLALLRKTQQGYFDILRRHSTLAGGCLELGPDIGLFTECCVAQGRFEKLWLFEPKASSAAHLRDTLGAIPHEVISRTFDPDAMPDACVSTAAAIHVLDHVHEPRATLEGIRRKLGSGGVLLLVTHDESSLLARAAGRRWPPYALAHPQLFNPKTLGDVLSAVGLRVLETVRAVNHFPAADLVNRLLRAVGGPASLLPGWGAPAFALRLGNIAVVAVRD